MFSEKTLPRLTLKKGKEKPLLQKHHWIYSGAIATLPETGDIAQVFSSEGKKVGLALLSRGHSITGHMIAFGEEGIKEAIWARIRQALALRRAWFNPTQTNAYRLIHAEGDGIPGLIIDCYADVFVLQISHPAIEALKKEIVAFLKEECFPSAIYEKSSSFLRKKEGLSPSVGLLDGEDRPQVEIIENGLRFLVDILEGQKTGFFLDQREMRHWVKELSFQKRVLNCFSYSGGFSIAALKGGAAFVDSVDSSGKCIAWMEQNTRINHVENHRAIQEDVFSYLKTTHWNYDLIILDPPAFVKKREDVPRAFRAYKELNAHVMKNMLPNSLLLTCSCSYHIEETLFQNILFRSAVEAGRTVRIIGRHRLAVDHPISIFHPESSYLKSFLLSIS